MGVSPGAAATRVLDVLQASGIEAWIVGGWVRDALLGIHGHDVDVCASGSWEENEAALAAAGIAVVESGAKFGGITAVLCGERIEVTAYRLDGFYTDGRHPEAVQLAGSIEEDLARRDFTVNAMAWHPARGLLDLYDGRGDLERRQIRAVGDARTRFEEDALRMLRAVRFACRLDFRIEPATAEALASCAPLLDAVARERVGIELDGILGTGRGGGALTRYPETMCAAVPELARSRGFGQHSRYHVYDVYGHTARVLTAAGGLALSEGRAPSRPLMWACLLHDIAKPDTFTLDDDGNGHFYGHPELGAREARGIMRRLSVSGDVIRDACLLIRYHDLPLKPERASILTMMRVFSGEGVDTCRLMGELFDIKRADTLGKAPSCFYYVEDIERMRTMCESLFESGDAYSLKTLALKGADLIAAGVAPGRTIGDLLGRALDAHIAGKVANDRAELLSYLGL